MIRFLRKYWVQCLGIGVSAAAVFWLLDQFDFAEVGESFRQVRFLALWPLPILVLVSFLLRSERWRQLVEHNPTVRYWQSFRALMVGYFFNTILPARMGDFLRAVYLARSEVMSRTKVFATLVTERVLDLAVTLGIMALVLLSYPALPVWMGQAGLLLSIAVACGLVVLVGVHFVGRANILPLIAWLTKRLGRRVSNKLQEMFLSGLDGVAGAFRPARITKFLGLTALIWAVEILIVFATARAIGFELALGNCLLVLLIIAVGSMVPSSPGFIGTYEFFGVAALSVLGYQGADGLAFIVLLHVVTLFSSLTLGFACFLSPEGARRSPDDLAEQLK